MCAAPQEPPRFRWGCIWVVVAIALAMWLAAGSKPAITWDSVMDLLHVKNRERYTQLAVLGVLICGACAVARILGYGKRKDR